MSGAGAMVSDVALVLAVLLILAWFAVWPPMGGGVAFAGAAAGFAARALAAGRLLVDGLVFRMNVVNDNGASESAGDVERKNTQDALAQQKAVIFVWYLLTMQFIPFSGGDFTYFIALTALAAFYSTVSASIVSRWEGMSVAVLSSENMIAWKKWLMTFASIICISFLVVRFVEEWFSDDPLIRGIFLFVFIGFHFTSAARMAKYWFSEDSNKGDV